MGHGQYLCSCGAEGFVDVGKGQANRYPCRLCYKAGMNRAAAREYSSFFNTPAGMLDLNFPDENTVEMAQAKKIIENSKISS